MPARVKLQIQCDECGRPADVTVGLNQTVWGLKSDMKAESGSLDGWTLPFSGAPIDAPILCPDHRKES